MSDLLEKTLRAVDTHYLRAMLNCTPTSIPMFERARVDALRKLGMADAKIGKAVVKRSVTQQVEISIVYGG